MEYVILARTNQIPINSNPGCLQKEIVSLVYQPKLSQTLLNIITTSILNIYEKVSNSFQKTEKL